MFDFRLEDEILQQRAFNKVTLRYDQLQLFRVTVYKHLATDSTVGFFNEFFTLCLLSNLSNAIKAALPQWFLFMRHAIILNIIILQECSFKKKCSPIDCAKPANCDIILLIRTLESPDGKYVSDKDAHFPRER